MFKQTFLSIMLIGAGAIGFAATPASALPLPAAGQAPLDTASNTELLQEAASRPRHRFNRHYNLRRHGPRCSYRRGNCRHYYGGFYYNNPWWLVGPAIGAAVILSAPRTVYAGGSRHVAWCRSKYRSYDARTNTWIAYGGEVRRCYSPYR